MTLDTDISARMREDILDGALAFGSRVTIAQLAQRYGVSQMPVRMAFSQLQGEGLLIISNTGRTSIRALSREFVNNVFDIRGAMEALLIRAAAKNISPSELAQLEAIEAELERRVESGDFAEVQKANRLFHRVIALAAHNPDAVELYDRHFFLVSALWRRVDYGPERFSGVVNDHRFIIKTLRLKDSDAAELLTRSHVLKAKLVMLEHLEKILPASPSRPSRKRN